MGRFVSLLLLLALAGGASAQVSASAMATARIIRPTAIVTASVESGQTAAGVELTTGSEKIQLALAASRADIAAHIKAGGVIGVRNTYGPTLLLTSESSAENVIQVTVHNR